MAIDDPYLTINDIKAELHVSHETVRQWILSGRLPHVKAGRMYRVRRSELERMLAATPLTSAGISRARPRHRQRDGATGPD